MRAAVLALVTAGLLGVLAALRLRRDAMAWAGWDADPMETDEHEAGVPMTWAGWDLSDGAIHSVRLAGLSPSHGTWHYRGEVN